MTVLDDLHEATTLHSDLRWFLVTAAKNFRQQGSLPLGCPRRSTA